MSDLAILPVCYCTAHDGPHVHLPQMIDSQYGLRVRLLADAAPASPAPSEEAPATEGCGQVGPRGASCDRHVGGHHVSVCLRTVQTEEVYDCWPLAGAPSSEAGTRGEGDDRG